MRHVAIIFMLASLIGCATLFTGTSEDISINSIPGGATIVVERGNIVVFEGTTPTLAKLRRGKDYKITLSLEGYKPKTIHLPKGGISKAAFLNLLSIPMWGIDFLTGALYRFDNKLINVTLKESSSLDSSITVEIAVHVDGKIEQVITTELEPL